jgi:predicted type IV restriction endonuclease
MDFIDKIRELAARIPKQLDHIQTEEATKNALIMPFIAALGYNVFDPTEVTPELCADVGVKKGEKVDYAILKDGKPAILFECKHHGADLSKVHASQLYRYFSVTEARFGVLTNGIVYWFYTDLEALNKMDAKPFFEFNMLDIRESAVEELKKFSKTAFDLNNILTTAAELKYTREIRRIMAEQMAEPSEEFVRFFASQVYTGRMTQAVREQFTQLTRQALRQWVNDQINERLKTALASDGASVQPVAEQPTPAAPANGTEASDPALQTTEEEREAFHLIRAILRDTVSVKRIAMRDAKSYCAILLDDNNRKPICRLHFNGSQKYVGFLDGPRDNPKDGPKEERIAISEIDDLYVYAERLKASASRYDAKATPSTVAA